MRAALMWWTLPVPQPIGGEIVKWPRGHPYGPRWCVGHSRFPSPGVGGDMENAKSLREIALGDFPQMAIFWLLADRPKCLEPHRGNLLALKKCSLSFEKSVKERHPICGKMDTQKLLNVPLQSPRRHARGPIADRRPEGLGVTFKYLFGSPLAESGNWR